MSLTITPLYGGLIGLLLVFLSVRVIFRRRSAKVSVGDGADKDLQKRVRVQANCAEYAPIGLILLAMAELQGAPGWVAHFLGLMLLTGRVVHAYGLGVTPQVIPMRKLGMALTFLMLILTALANIGHALS
ncbi:MAPEG family protein [uncultured Roseovarius sp.]|uniref:MAPEG family protein n=1 Tax=uncultured Roseovarius sp. TaxID=293344 RepID=UPI002610ACF0|nr:MAPEG family protein [uncultured Roseovarius sp.]